MQINFHIHKSTDHTGTKTNIKLFSNKRKNKDRTRNSKNAGVASKILIGIFAFFAVLFTIFYLDENTVSSKVTHVYEAIENPNAFDSNCYIDEEYYSAYMKDDIANAAKLLYQKTGIQYYHCEIDIQNTDCETEQDVTEYISQWIKDNIPHPEYALIKLIVNSKETEQKDEYGYEVYIGYRDEFIIGEKTEEFLDYEAINLLKECYEVTNADWDYEQLGKCFERFIDETMNFNKKNTQHTVITVFVIVLMIGVVAGFIAYKLHRQHIEDTIRILNADIDNLEEEALKEKYLNEEQNDGN